MGVVLLGVLLVACRRRQSVPGAPFRLGYFPNLTHAQALVGVDSGAFQTALGATPLVARSFNAGPAAMEALLAGALDACYVGAAPALIANARAPGMLHIVSGSVSGGAGLFVRTARRPQDLLGKRVASPQLGNTQDVALRHWLRKMGLKASNTTGPRNAVWVTPLSNPDILSLFKRGDLEGAWVPEPWGARLVAEAHGRLMLDERQEWPSGQFPTTVLVVTEHALKTRRAEVQRLVDAHVALTDRARADPLAFSEAANRVLGKLTSHPLAPGVLAQATSRLSFQTDLLVPELKQVAEHAAELRYLPSAELGSLVDTSLLETRSALAPPDPP